MLALLLLTLLVLTLHVFTLLVLTLHVFTLLVLALLILALLVLTLLVLALLVLALLLVTLLVLTIGLILGLGRLLGFRSGLCGIRSFFHGFHHLVKLVCVLRELVVLGAHLLLRLVELLLCLRESVLYLLGVALRPFHVAFLHLLCGILRRLCRFLGVLGRLFGALGSLVLVHLLGAGLVLDVLRKLVGFAREVGYVLRELLLFLGRGLLRGVIAVLLGLCCLLLNLFLFLLELLALLGKLLRLFDLLVEVLLEVVLDCVLRVLDELLLLLCKRLGVDLVLLGKFGKRLLPLREVLHLLEIFGRLRQDVELALCVLEGLNRLFRVFCESLARAALLVPARQQEHVFRALSYRSHVLVEDWLEHLGARVETAVDKSFDKFRKKAFRVLHLGFRLRAGLLRLVAVPLVLLGDCIAANRALEAPLGELQVVENVLHVLLRAFDLRGKRLPPERLRVLRARASHHDFGRIGDARAAEFSREVVLDLDAEAHDRGVVEPTRDEVDHMGAAPRDVARLLRFKLLVLLPRTSANAGLERSPRKPEVVLYVELDRETAVHWKLQIERLWRGKLHFRRRVLHYCYGRGVNLVGEAVGIPDRGAPATLDRLRQVEREREPAVFRLDSRNSYVARERERTGHARTRRLRGHRDLRALEADDRRGVGVGVRLAAGILGMANLDRPSGIPRLRHDLDPVRARQSAATAYAVVEALRDARIGERVDGRSLCAFLRFANHALDCLALSVETRTHKRARREAAAHREPERKRSSLEHDLVARRDLERRSVNVVDLRGRDKRSRRKTKRRVWERGKKEREYSHRDCGGDEARLYGPSSELLPRRDRLDVLHRVLGDLLHEPGGRSEVASLRELHDSRKSLLELRVVALDEGGDLGRSELAP